MAFHVNWQEHYDEDYFYYDNFTLKNTNVGETLGNIIFDISSKQVKN